MKTEFNIQQEIVVFFRNNYCLKHHKKRCAIFSVPNEAAYKNKSFIQTGLMVGVSDLIVVINSKTVFFEVKTEKGKQSPKQIEFEETIKNLNQDYYIVRSLEQFKKIIQTYLNI